MTDSICAQCLAALTSRAVAMGVLRVERCMCSCQSCRMRAVMHMSSTWRLRIDERLCNDKRLELAFAAS